MVILIIFSKLLRKDEGEQKVLLALFESFWSVHRWVQMFLPSPPSIPPFSLVNPPPIPPTPTVPHVSHSKKEIFSCKDITFSIFLIVQSRLNVEVMSPQMTSCIWHHDFFSIQTLVLDVKQHQKSKQCRPWPV